MLGLRVATHASCLTSWPARGGFLTIELEWQLLVLREPAARSNAENPHIGLIRTEPDALQTSVVANGLQRLHDLHTVILAGGQPISLQGFLRRCLGIILSIPNAVDVQPQHDSFVAGCLNRQPVT